MQQKLQTVLDDIEEAKLTVKTIVILCQENTVKSPSAEPEEPRPSTSKPEPSTSKESVGLVASANSDVEQSLKYLKLKGEIEKTQQKMQKLEKMIEFISSSLELGKFDQDRSSFDEIKSLLRECKSPQGDVLSALEKTRDLAQVLEDNSRHVESMELTVESAYLIGQIKDQDERVEEINDALKRIHRSTTKIFGVKSTCVNINVSAGDEVGKLVDDPGSGSPLRQAVKEQKRGNRALSDYDYAEALRCYNAAMKLDPNRMMYRLGKADVFLAQGKYQKCKKECQIVLNGGGSDKSKARAREILGEIDLRTYNILEALDHFEKCVQLYTSAGALTARVQDKFQHLNKSFNAAFEAGQRNFFVQTMQVMDMFANAGRFGLPPLTF